MWRLAAGARAVADFRFDQRNEGTGSLFYLEATTRSGMTETSSAPEPAKFLRKQRFDELVQWMVQDASPGRCDR
jgi:D-alanine-D-alanine ligase